MKYFTQKCIAATFLMLLLGVNSQAQIVYKFAPDTISNGGVFGLSLTKKGDVAYFVRSNKGRKELMIYSSEKKEGKWQAPKPAFFAGNRNYEWKEIDPFINAEGNCILYNSTENTNKTNNIKKDFDIWMIKKEGAVWQTPVPLNELNSDSTETFAVMTKSKNIYFNSTRKGGFGKGDIYVSKFVNGKYQTPENLGYPINTNENESNNYVDAEERFVIFSGKYSSTFGNSDLYISFNRNGSWSLPHNLGSIINSSANEFCPSMILSEPNKLYFARLNVEGTVFNEDIYYTKINLELFNALSLLHPKPVFSAVFPQMNVYGINFLPNNKTAYTTRSNMNRSICEVISLSKNKHGEWVNPQVEKNLKVTNNVANVTISHDGMTLIARVSNGTNPDLYLSKWANNNWSTPIPLPGTVNTAKDEYYPELSVNNHLYFASSGDIYEADFINEEWTNVRPLPFPINTNNAESNPALSRDGNIMVFLSNREGGFGSYDLYISKKEENNWSTPINLGPQINTNAWEYQPRFSPDNKKLYFTRSYFEKDIRIGTEAVYEVAIDEVLKNLKSEKTVNP